MRKLYEFSVLAIFCVQNWIPLTFAKKGGDDNIIIIGGEGFGGGGGPIVMDSGDKKGKKEGNTIIILPQQQQKQPMYHSPMPMQYEHPAPPMMSNYSPAPMSYGEEMLYDYFL